MTSSSPVRQAVVLAGGFGSRLGALTEVTPKPLLPIDGRPFIAYLIGWLARSGIDDIVVSTGYMPEKFAEFFGLNAWHDPYGRPVRVSEARENIPAGTAGALALMADRLDERFVLVNGDTFFDCDLPSIIGTADRLQAGEVAMAVRSMEDSGRYGRLEIDDRGRVLSFSQKGEPGPGAINAGISVLDRSVVDLIQAVPCSLEHEIYPRLAADGRLVAIERSGYFIDIGVPETYELAQAELPAKCMKPAVFFDRGSLLKVGGYTSHAGAFGFTDGAVAAIKAARCAGYLTVLVTNQAGVAKDCHDVSSGGAFHRGMNAHLREHGAWIDAFYSSFSSNTALETCPGRRIDQKSEQDALVRAVGDLNIDRSRSFLIGDREAGMTAAKRAGIRTYLHMSGPVNVVVNAALVQR